MDSVQAGYDLPVSIEIDVGPVNMCVLSVGDDGSDEEAGEAWGIYGATQTRESKQTDVGVQHAGTGGSTGHVATCHVMQERNDISAQDEAWPPPPGWARLRPPASIDPFLSLARTYTAQPVPPARTEAKTHTRSLSFKCSSGPPAV